MLKRVEVVIQHNHFKVGIRFFDSTGSTLRGRNGHGIDDHDSKGHCSLRDPSLRLT
ncbi:MAG: hypothetical protein RLZZ568_61 [Cyanobacteriota bacterium]